MAKIDTSSIAGYGDMTPEQKLAALESFEIDVPKPDYSGYVKKEVLDKATHDAAEWKKKYNAQLTDDEQARQTLIDENESMKTELNTLRREKNVTSYTAQFVAQGYDSKLAESTASAMADGDMATVFANQQKFIDQLKADKKAEEMKNMGKPKASGEGTDKEVTKKTFLKMGYEEKRAYIADHPDWKNELK